MVRAWRWVEQTWLSARRMRIEGLPMLKEACWTGVLAAALLVASIVWWIASPAPADAQ